MLVLGIDPGTATTGFGILKIKKPITQFEGSNGHLEAIEFGLIETDKELDPGVRLHKIHDHLNKILKVYKPDVMAIEQVFFSTNRKTAIRVGQAIGVMLYCASTANTQVVEYAPGTIKKIVTGNGRADKKDVQQALRAVLGAKVRSRPMKKTHFDNAADALAVAVCHAVKVEM